MIRRISASLASKRSALDQKEKGFTLIELLVVVIIIGILAAVAIPIFLGQQASAKASAVEAAIANAKISVVAAIVEDTTFPTTLVSGNADVTLAITGSADAFCIVGTHTDLTGAADTWAADDSSGVVQGGCSAAFIAG